MGALIARCDSQKKRLHVEFDANMNPIGKEEDNFISYLGYLARSKVHIVYSHWKLVPPKAKELIWAQILQTFDVPNNKAMYKHWMGEEFVASQQNPEFLEKAEANRERQARNKYPHYMSRGGYKKLERKMMEEELERMKEASQADPSIVVQPPARPPRHQKWKAVRMKGDKYINADVAEVSSKIDALEEQSSQSSFTPATRMDILSTTIGKPNYLDAVRGETRGVSVAKYFGRRSRCSHDDDNPSPQLIAKIRANLVDEIMAQGTMNDIRDQTNVEAEFDPIGKQRDIEITFSRNGEHHDVLTSQKDDTISNLPSAVLLIPPRDVNSANASVNLAMEEIKEVKEAGIAVNEKQDEETNLAEIAMKYKAIVLS
ncbi:hypothetical protein K1719_032416 [Acacia pycnantha]|nr:hypothetical protein K1719_032416 [Acacia pycnantha]